MPLLPPDGALDLPGARVRSVGVSGQVDAVALEGPGATARGDVRDVDEQLAEHAVPGVGARALAGALAQQDLRPVLAVPLDDLVTAPGAGPVRGLDGEPAVELTVEAPPDGEGQVILEVDAAGVVSWHWAMPADQAAGGDRAGLEQVFRIPVQQLDVPGEGPPSVADRGVFGIGTKKLLQLLRYPVEQVAGTAGRLLVTAWESRHRPYRLSRLDTPGRPLGPDDLAALSGQPALLLVHGTFSTCASAFDSVLRDAGFLARLRDQYGPRILLFDHPSVHVDPTANARWLLEQLPPDAELVLDVVAHSRGGLVARALASGPVATEAARRPATLRTTVHVATPNAGTVLADPQRWGDLLDSMTNLAMLFPDDTVSVPLTAVIETVKQIGTGVVGGLDGLSAMTPGSDWLSRLARGSAGGKTYAVASDFDPVSAPLPVRALNVLVDPFFGEGNDLVVPTNGVSQAPGLTVDDTLALPQTPAISHNVYFRDEAVRTRIADWLPPPA
jgi:hypothetical protein